MKAVLSGVLVAVAVFLVLLFIIAGGTGTVELLLWLALAVVSGVLTMRAIRSKESADS